MISRNQIFVRFKLTARQFFLILIVWKFDASLIDDDDFVTMINESVPMWLKEFDEVTGKRLLCMDLIKYRIGQVSIKYSKEERFLILRPL